MRRNHLSLVPPLRPATPSLTLFLFFSPSTSLSLTLSRSLPIYTCPLLPYRTVSYERRHYSAGWNSVVSRPRARAKAPFLLPSPSRPLSHSRVPPHTASFANTRHPLFVVTCRLFEFCLSLSDLGAFPPRSPQLSLSRSLRRSLERLSPFSTSTPVNPVSLRPTLKFSLSLTRAPSFRHAPSVGRTLSPLASLCCPLSHSVSFSLSSSLSLA